MKINNRLALLIFVALISFVVGVITIRIFNRNPIKDQPKVIALAKPVAPQVETPTWIYGISKDQITDEKSYISSITNVDGAMLAVYCGESKKSPPLAIVLYFAEYFKTDINNNKIEVRYRIGTHPYKTFTAIAASNYEKTIVLFNAADIPKFRPYNKHNEKIFQMVMTDILHSNGDDVIFAVGNNVETFTIKDGIPKIEVALGSCHKYISDFPETK